MKDLIVLHCTATAQTATVDAIQRYWRDVLGWKNPGYHYIYPASGEEVKLLDEEKTANGARGFNRRSVHLAYIGGLTEDDRTPQQKTAMYSRIIKLRCHFIGAKVVGHYELNPKKDCPRFNARQWLFTHQSSLTT